VAANFLTSLSALSNLSKLSFLKASHNQIENFPAFLSHLLSLEFVDLEGKSSIIILFCFILFLFYFHVPKVLNFIFQKEIEFIKEGKYQILFINIQEFEK